ncbi:universal stress protein [Spirulina sp. CS-785/01]|uniref:universal stress protein n=1 Tax=Spirulina sp. CS-785/01 TaxID=3021716 RepID=UPI0023304C9F|nr:universal stress protein [Spirulina sp. CS-785/01]MDB9315039.1 universal stress protein [Spirulina sp. CS-785/01]
MIKKILLADSGTGNPEEMLQSLLDLPNFKNVSVTILHVVPSQVSEGGMETKMAEGDKILAEAADKLNLDNKLISTIKRQGEPKDTVCQVAEEIGADLIIMGSRGLKRLVAILENSVSQYVFQLTDRPMLLVKDDIYVTKIKRVMIALGKTPTSQASLDLTLSMLNGAKGVEVILTRVNPDLDPKLLPLSKADIENNPVIADALPKVKRMGIPYRCIVTGGKPGEQICKLAEDNNVDLLVIGSPERRPSVARGLPDLDRLLGTSLSDYVRVNANCPVLLSRELEEA